MENPFEALSQKMDRVETMLSMLLSQPAAGAPAAPEPLLTAEQAAAVLGISKSAVYQNLDALPVHKRFGRLYFYESELHDFIRASPERKK